MISSRNITEAAQKRASEILDKLGDDDLYEEEERDREKTVDDIIRSDCSDKPVHDQPKADSKKAETVAPDETELISEHVEVDPVLNQLYLEKEKITEKILKGCNISDDEDEEKSTHEVESEVQKDDTDHILDIEDQEGEDGGNNTCENPIETNNYIMADPTESLSNRPNTESTEEILSFNSEQAEQSPTDNSGITRRHEKVRRKCQTINEGRKKQQSESEEGEISDDSDSRSMDNEDNWKSTDLDKEITDDWNFLHGSTGHDSEKSYSKRTKRKKKKRGKGHGHRDKKDKHHRREEKVSGSHDSRKIRNDDDGKEERISEKGSICPEKNSRSHDRKEKIKKVDKGLDREKNIEENVEKEQKVQTDKMKRVREHFKKASLFGKMNMEVTATKVSDSDKDLTQEPDRNPVNVQEKPVMTPSSIPKFNTEALKKILATVSKEQQIQDSSRHSAPSERTDDTSSLSPNLARKEMVGPVEYLAQSKGLSIPGADYQERIASSSPVNDPTTTTRLSFNELDVSSDIKNSICKCNRVIGETECVQNPTLAKKETENNSSKEPPREKRRSFEN